MNAFWRILLLVLLTRGAVWIAAYAGAAARVAHESGLPAPQTCFDAEVRPQALESDIPGEIRARVAAARSEHLRGFAPLLRWDAGHYLSIVEHGYQLPTRTGAMGEKRAPAEPAGRAAPALTAGAAGAESIPQSHDSLQGSRARVDQQSNIVFFPLYPLLSGAVGQLVGPRAGLVIVSNAAALLAAAAMFLWLRRSIGERVASLAVLLAFCWPHSAFWSFGYAESLTLLLFVLALASLETGRPWTAAGLCALATAARPTAIVAALVLGLAAMVRRAGGRPAESTGRAPAAGSTRRAVGDLTDPAPVASTSFPGLASVSQALEQAAPAVSADSFGRRCAHGLAIALVASAGLIAWLGWLAWTTGSLLIYPRTLQSGWFGESGPARWTSFLLGTRIWGQFKYIGRALREFPDNLGLLASPLAWQMPLSLLLVGASALAWRQATPPWRAYLLTAPLIFLMRYAQSGWSDFGLESMGRYVGLAAPAFAALAIGMASVPRWIRAALLTTLISGQLALAWRYGFGGWCG